MGGMFDGKGWSAAKRKLKKICPDSIGKWLPWNTKTRPEAPGAFSLVQQKNKKE